MSQPSRIPLPTIPSTPFSSTSAVTITLTAPSPIKTTRVLLRSYAAPAKTGSKKVGFEASPELITPVERWIEDARGAREGPWAEVEKSDREPDWSKLIFGHAGQEAKGAKKCLAWGDVHPRKLYAEY